MADMPEPKATVQIPKADIIEGLLRVLTGKVDEMSVKQSKICAEIDILIEEGKNQNQRLSGIEERLGRTSSRARAVSDSDLKQESKIADEIIRREKIEKEIEAAKAQIVELHTKTDAQTQILTRLNDNAAKIVSNPWVRLILFIVGSTLAAKYGIKVLPGGATQ